MPLAVKGKAPPQNVLARLGAEPCPWSYRHAFRVCWELAPRGVLWQCEVQTDTPPCNPDLNLGEGTEGLRHLVFLGVVNTVFREKRGHRG